jgi:cytochrome c-type biogenesis protein CcmF
MSLAHVGVGIFILGVAFTNAFSSDRDVRMGPGQSETLAGYRFEFDGVRELPGPNYRAERATLRVFKDGEPVATLHPEKRLYPIQSQPMTEAAIDAGFTRDLYVALGEHLGDGSWALRLYYKPLIRWIWLGPLLMALGGLLAASDRRYRGPRVVKAAAAQTPPEDALSAGAPGA